MSMNAMKGRLLDWYVSTSGKQRVVLELDGDIKSEYDELAKDTVSVVMRKARGQRSLDANAYAWVLIDKLAEVLGVTKEEVYCTEIRSIGGVSETVCVRNDAVEKLVKGWKHSGIGWQAETTESKIPGCTNVILYYGSSTYDTRQMSTLIEQLVQDCKANDIETLTPEQLSILNEEWGIRQ